MKEYYQVIQHRPGSHNGNGGLSRIASTQCNLNGESDAEQEIKINSAEPQCVCANRLIISGRNPDSSQ
jgi:hypothetical protein